MKIWWTLVLSAFCLIVYGVTAPLSDTGIRSRVVPFQTDNGFCTGEQVRAPSGAQYTLTAGHCVSLGSKIKIRLPSGKTRTIRFLAESPTSDLALYTGIPELPAFRVAAELYTHDSIRIFSRGSGLPIHTVSGESLGSIDLAFPLHEAYSRKCNMPKNFMAISSEGLVCGLQVKLVATSAWSTPGASGGPVVNYYGELVGVVSAGDMHYTFIVPPDQIREFLKKR